MCRLLGWAARTPVTLADLLGEADLDAFTALSRKHGDGWGVAVRSGRGIDAHTSPDAACYSREYEQRTHSLAGDLGIVHLRWATLGLPVQPSNTHPFTDDGVAFAHNGSVQPPSALDELLTDKQQAAMRGTTDSERYFRAVLSAAAHAPLQYGLAHVVDRIARTKDFTSLNCLLMTPDTLFAACRFNPGAEDDEGEDYFHLRYRVTDDAVVVASSGWGSDWQVLDNGALLTVDRATLRTSVVSLDEVLIGS
jgi:predicted glutamine amidotransferase